jgi:long-subunit fatty acid transport protein
MNVAGLSFALGLCLTGTAAAGGLFLPGSGAVSTSRAGAAVASVDDGEALALNPAGMAKAKGTTITIGAAAINYYMSFHRNGSYDQNPDDVEAYEGQRYGVVENRAKPPLGIGRFQPVPVIAIVSDLGGKIPNLHVGAGLYAPNGYPFRDLNNVNGRRYFVPNDQGGYDFPTFGNPPPPTRYDLISQEAAVMMPSVAVAYRVLPELDLGGRFSVGRAHVKSSLAVWGKPANHVEWVKADGLFTLDATDSFVTAWSLGAAYRPVPQIELGAQYTAQINMLAEGNAHAVNGPHVDLNGQPFVILPVDDRDARCAPGGTRELQKGCVEFALPMTATLGGRYIFLGEDGKQRGDVELGVTWENWSAQRASDFKVVVDGQVATENMPDNGITLKDNLVRHGLRDTYGIRLGGSYTVPLGDQALIARGGVAYDTAAAKPGWERVDFDGAARTTLAIGASYKLPKVRFDAGFGYVHEGTRTDSRNCNPTFTVPATGCGPGGGLQPVDERQGPDPINPIVVPEQQAENPVNQGTYKSHYLMLMLGMSTWF